MRSALATALVVSVAFAIVLGAALTERKHADPAERDRAWMARRWERCKHICPAELRPALVPKGCACLPPDVKVLP